MSGWIGIGVKTNDGQFLYAQGYTRSAYDVFSYMELFEGDDSGAKAFIESWNKDDDAVPPHLLRDEYGSFFVDFPGRRIVVDHDQDVPIASTPFNSWMSKMLLDSSFFSGMLDAGRMTLTGHREGADEPMAVTRAYLEATSGMKGVKAENHAEHGVVLEHLWTGRVTLHLDYAPFSVITYPETDEGRQAYAKDAEATGFALHPHYHLTQEEFWAALD